MINYRHLINIRQIAVHNVMEDDIEFYVEKCYRYYSKTYHTPLHLAKEAITPEEVVKIYMEDEMAEWTAEEIEDLRNKIDETPKMVLAGYANKATEEIDEEVWIAQQSALLKKQEESQKAKQEEIIKETHKVIEKLTSSLKGLNGKE
jgi:hypothetical protein